MPDFNRGRNPQGQRSGSNRPGTSGTTMNRGGPPRHGSGGGAGGDGDGQKASAQHAAVPWYLGDQFNDAPPGHRYLMYLPFWKQDWTAIKEGKQRVLKDLGAIPQHAQQAMKALAQRQRDMGTADGVEMIDAVSTSPFATGLGWEHPNENGFAFLHPYGLPYLAGSGVKGVLRRAAQNLADGPEEDAHGWTKDAIMKMFGLEPESGSDKASRGALRFFDAIPEIGGNGMSVDIMNPHYGEYYQGNATPHDAGSPVPIFFLVVPSGSKFTFIVDCPRERLMSEDLRTHWRAMIRAAFTHAFDWLGFGAKTAVGYGAMRPPSGHTAQGEPTQERQEGSASSFTATEQVWENVTLRWDAGGGGRVTAAAAGKSATASGKESEQFLVGLSAEQRERLKKKKELRAVSVVVEEMGNRITLKRLA